MNMNMFKLKDIPLFSALGEMQLAELQVDMLVKHYNKDSIVFYEGDESDYMHILIEGNVRLYMTSPKGAQLHMHNFTAPEIVAFFATFEHMPFPATCEFTTEGVMGLLQIEKLYEYLNEVDFSRSLINALSKRMKLHADLLHKETIYSSEAKIADLIYNNPEAFQRQKNNEIASTLNMTPETLSRILTKLKREEIITINKHVVTILNENALQDIIETNSIKKVHQIH